MAVSKRLRYEILRRDNHMCKYCGAKASDVQLVIDHVTPVTLGGRDEPSNLVAACVACNAGKSSSHVGAPFVEDIDEEAFARSVAMRKATQTPDWRRRAIEIHEERKLTEAQMELAIEARNAWLDAWVAATNGQLPEDRALDLFLAELTDYVRAGCPRDELLPAVRQSGATRYVFIDFPDDDLFDCDEDEEVTV
jgi:hypothetical protein